MIKGGVYVFVCCFYINICAWAVFRQRRLLAYPPTISHCPYSKIIVSGRFKWHVNTYKSSQLTKVSLRLRGSVRSVQSLSSNSTDAIFDMTLACGLMPPPQSDKIHHLGYLCTIPNMFICVQCVHTKFEHDRSRLTKMCFFSSSPALRLLLASLQKSRSNCYICSIESLL